MSVVPDAAPPREPEIPRLAAALIVLGIPTVLFNRALLPALPGSRSGIEQLLDHLTLVGAVLSQLLALGLVLLTIKLIVSSLGDFALGIVGRLLALPVGSAVAFLLLAAMNGPLDSDLQFLLAGFGTLALLSSLKPTLRQPSMRAAGLLLLLVFLGSLCYSAGRILALKASVEALPQQYALARGLTTAGLVFDLLSLLWTALWLVVAAPKHTEHQSRAVTIAYVATAIAAGVTCALLGHLGHGSRANFVEVIIGRAIFALTREPSPYLTTLLSPILDVISLVFAALLLSRPGHIPGPSRWAMALLLLGRCAPDIPMHTALLTAGSLLLAWYSPNTLSTARDRVSTAAIPGAPLDGPASV